MLAPYLERCPLVAILRGIEPPQATAVAEVLIEAGFSILEVPLNSPGALDSIKTISNRFGGQTLIGAGTVTDCEQVEQVAQAGGRLIVSPNCDAGVIEYSKKLALISLPGCCTPSEIFAALAAGADAIKLFPATMISPATVAALRAILPPVPLLAVGGIDEQNFSKYRCAGIDGFGIGSSLYQPGYSLEEIRARAVALVRAGNAEP